MERLINVRNIVTRFGENLVHDGISLQVNEGEIFGLLGPSGCGKSTLMRQMLMLEKFQGGFMDVLGYDVSRLAHSEAQSLRRQWGVLFQNGALYSSLSVAENIAVVLSEYTDISKALINEIVAYKINLVGLQPNDGLLYPSQLSGGMRKKAALARALAMDPKLLFLDEPTSGLDPVSARDFDRLIVELRDMLNLTIVMVSHDLRSIRSTLDRMAVIDQRKIAAEGSLAEVVATRSPFIDTFFKATDE